MTQRLIKSFVLRAGRISNRQQHALDNWLTCYQLPTPGNPWDLPQQFGREAQTVVEIGFGMGGSLLTMASNKPEVNFIGIEVHRAGIGSLVADLYEQHLVNVRVAPYDAVDVFTTCLEDNSLSGVQIFFPDPWPKKKHHKRRLIQAQFVKLISSKIKPGGFIHIATDWQDYAEQILSVLMQETSLINQQTNGGFTPRPETRPLTKFEQRGHSLGHQVWDMVFNKKYLDD